MANKPTKAEYEGFKKAVANPMTPAPIKQKLQSIIDQYSSEYEGGSEAPKAEPKSRAGRKPSTPRATKKTATDIEKAKAEIKAKTGKTEEECEAIIEQYRALRSKAQEGKRKAEKATATNRKRVAKLEDKGDLIEGTNVKTADAVIETTAQEVAEKIEQEIEAVEAKAETEAKAEVAKDNTKKTQKQKKEAVEAKVEKKVKERTKIIVKKVVIDTSALLASISESLGKFDKDSQKEFLIKLRSDIDTLLSKYAFGGMTDGATQVMNVQQSNLSASSVNPTLFANGGEVSKGDKYVRVTFYYRSLKNISNQKPDSKPEDRAWSLSSFTKYLNAIKGKVTIKYLGDYSGIVYDNETGKRFMSFDEETIYANGGGVDNDLTFVSGEAFYVTEESAKNSNMSFDTLSDTYFDSEYDFDRMIRNGAILSFDFSVEVRNEWNIRQAIYDQMESEGVLENEGDVQIVGYRLFTHPNDFNDSLPYDSDDYNDDDDYEDDDEYAKGGGVKGVRRLTEDEINKFYSQGLEYFGFKEGDLINYAYLGDSYDEFNEDEYGREFLVSVENESLGKNAQINPFSGRRIEFDSFAEGGRVKTNSKEVKQKIRQHILDSVYDYNENEFDNFNDASQHLSDEFKRVADYPNNIRRYPNNQKRFKDYLQGIPFNFFIYDDDIEDFLNGLGINPKNKKYSSDQMWDLYSLLIWREIEPTYKSNKFEDGGVVGQEIVFDDNGEENTGVIKDITNLGDYIVKADDGRTLLAQRELDVISLGDMRSASTEAPKKRFGFFAKGGRVFGEDARLEYVDDAFASDELKEKLMDKLGIETNSLGDNVVISFAYTDYGGDFLDKVAILYFQENYPENTLVENAGYGGQNAYVFGEPAQEWIDSTDDYPLGFEDIESFYYDMVNEAEYESFEYFLDDLERDDYVFDKDEVMDWLIENKGGYYSMTTQGLDFSYSDLTDELVDEGLISKEDEDEYARGGKLWIDTKTKGGLKGVKPSRKNSFTRQAQKRGLTSGQLASKVLANPSRYKDINPKSAQLVKNMGVRKHGGSIGDILRNRRGQ